MTLCACVIGVVERRNGHATETASAVPMRSSMNAEPRIRLLRTFGVHNALKTIEQLTECFARSQDFRIDVSSLGEDIG